MDHPEIFPFIMMLIVLPFVLLVVALKIIAFWKIFSRIGYGGAWSLFMLLPFGDIVLPLVVAFCRWPAVKQDPNQRMPLE